MKKKNLFISATLIATIGFSMFALPFTTTAQPQGNKAVPAPTPPKNRAVPAPTPSPVTVRKGKPKSTNFSWGASNPTGTNQRTRQPRRHR